MQSKLSLRIVSDIIVTCITLHNFYFLFCVTIIDVIGVSGVAIVFWHKVGVDEMTTSFHDFVVFAGI